MLDHFKHQKDNPDVNWKLPEDFTVAYGLGQGELEVGGVYEDVLRFLLKTL
ncbi:DnaJ sub C member 13 [Dissostichus eleginoides]|nr:DnaJ sub C member 13 [Dissostichus eleginoides]